MGPPVVIAFAKLCPHVIRTAVWPAAHPPPGAQQDMFPGPPESTAQQQQQGLKQEPPVPLISGSTAGAAGNKSVPPSSPSQSSNHDATIKQEAGTDADQANVSALMPTEFFEQGAAGVLQQIYDFAAQQQQHASHVQPHARPSNPPSTGPRDNPMDQQGPHLQLLHLFAAGAADLEPADRMQLDSTPGSILGRRKASRAGSDTSSTFEGSEGHLAAAAAAAATAAAEPAAVSARGRKRHCAGLGMQQLLAAEAAYEEGDTPVVPRPKPKAPNAAAGGDKLKFKGVRQRPWGKWASEIREPGTNNRVWLGKSGQVAAGADVL